jgi:hypothetical protein
MSAEAHNNCLSLLQDGLYARSTADPNDSLSMQRCRYCRCCR